MTPSDDGATRDLVRVGVVAPAVVNLPLWVAEDCGLLAKAGLRISETVCGTTDATTAALIGGDVDVALGTPEGALADPATLTILAALANKPPLSLVAQPGIGSIPELRGSAALQLVPYDYLAEDAGFSVLGRAEDYVPWFAFSTVCARTDWARADRRVVEALRGALLDAAARIHQDVDEAAEVATRHARISPVHARRAVLRLVEGGTMPRDLALHPEAERRTLAAMASPPAG